MGVELLARGVPSAHLAFRHQAAEHPLGWSSHGENSIQEDVRRLDVEMQVGMRILLVQVAQLPNNPKHYIVMGLPIQ